MLDVIFGRAVKEVDQLGGAQQEVDDGAVTRRALLASGGAAVVALSLPAEAAAAARHAHRRRHHRRHASHLRRSSYQQLIGERFRIVGSRVHLRLEAVQNLSAGPDGSENAFALVFRAPRRAPALRDQVPELHHARLGSFRLLVSPGQDSRRGRPYVAIINRTHR